MTVTGRLAPAGVVQKVHLDRYDARRKEWARLSTKPVTQTGAVAFRWTAERADRFYASRSRADLRPGYVPTVSRTAVVRGLTVALVPRLAIVARPT